MGTRALSSRLFVVLQARYVFNGDFVDRGLHGVEVFLVLLCLKVLFPEYVHLNRGNHECSVITAAYGFKAEAIQKYNLPMYRTFLRVFQALPLCLTLTLTPIGFQALTLCLTLTLIGFQALPLCTLIGKEESLAGKRIFVVHGGICEDKTVAVTSLCHAPLKLCVFN